MVQINTEKMKNIDNIGDGVERQMYQQRNSLYNRKEVNKKAIELRIHEYYKKT